MPELILEKPPLFSWGIKSYHLHDYFTENSRTHDILKKISFKTDILCKSKIRSAIMCKQIIPWRRRRNMAMLALRVG
jgi:hypothetical protein